LKKPICIFLVICVFLSVPISSFASTTHEDFLIARRYSFIDLLSAGLSIDGNGRATCRGTVQATYTYTMLSIEVSLQQSENNTWTTLETWTDSGPGYWSLEVTGNRYILSGYSYRVVSTATVYDANGNQLEKKSNTTIEKTY
jgi:hypothetical protein